MKKYPDVSELFKQKAAARKRLARLPIEEKMEIARRLTEAGRYAPGYLKPKRGRSDKFISTLRAVTAKKK